MEACVGAYHLSRQLLALGHDVKPLPAQFVKPFRESTRDTMMVTAASVLT
jgi:transposase